MQAIVQHLYFKHLTTTQRKSCQGCKYRIQMDQPLNIFNSPANSYNNSGGVYLARPE